MDNKLTALTLTTDLLTADSGIRHIAFEYGAYIIDFIYNGDYSEDKSREKIDLYKVKCIITNRMFLPKISYSVRKDTFVIDASQAIDSHMFDDNDIDLFIQQIETCREIIKIVRQTAHDYFTQYADKTVTFDAPDKVETQFNELLSSGRLYKLAGFPDLPDNN